MANLAKEGTTIRRVMESVFRYFDNGNLWSINHGLAFSVLKDILFLMDDSGMLFFLFDHKVLIYHLIFSELLLLLFCFLFHFSYIWLLQRKTHTFYCQC